MKEWLIQNLDLSVIISAASVLGSAVLSIISLVKTRNIKKAVADAKKKGYWTTCPVCKSTLSLNELNFHMPDGKIDDDLDGQAD